MLDGVATTPRLEVSSLYLDQSPAEDTGRALAARHRIPIFETIGEAMTLGGNGPLVDGVLLIGEHGDYPDNVRGQKMYPRRRFFDAAVSTMAARQRFVPLFTDKHLSWSYADAHYMVHTAHRLGIQMLAGSSLPVTWRRPPLNWGTEETVSEALAIGYSDVEAYGFHALETLQCMLERRRGGETGVSSVQCVEGDDVWRAGAQGYWSEELLRKALETIPDCDVATVRKRATSPVAFLLNYVDGLKAAVLMLDGVSSQFSFAARRSGNVEATWFWLEGGEPFSHFTLLVRQIESLIVQGRAPYPVERTLLTTGILEAAMRSRERRHETIATPELGVHYSPPATDWGAR